MDKIRCPFCKSENKMQILKNRIDFEFSISTKLTYWKCKNPLCQLIYVDPIPSNKEIISFYNDYSTHRSNKTISKLSIIYKLSRWFYNRELNKIFQNENKNDIKVLDFGCGNGNFLNELKKRHIINIVGYDFDIEACNFSKKQGFIVDNEIERIKDIGPFDFIFLNHVIEHFSDPIYELGIVKQLLKTGGTLIIRTPNSSSFLAKFFKENWRGWETPRHLFLYNTKNIFYLFNKHYKLEVKTSNVMFAGIYNGSIHTFFLINNIFGKILRNISLYLLYIFSSIFNTIFSTYGEELYIKVKKLN